MSWGLVLDIVPPIHVRQGTTTQNSTSTRSLPVPREQFSPTALPPATRKPHHHGLRRHDHVGSDAEPENFKTVNNAL